MLHSFPGPAGLGVVVAGSAVVDAGVAALAVGVFASIYLQNSCGFSLPLLSLIHI